MKKCPKCDSPMVPHINCDAVSGSAVIDSPQTITASGVASPQNYNWVCDNCGHTELGEIDSHPFHS